MSRVGKYLPGLLLFALGVYVCPRLLLVPVQRPDAFFGAPCDDNFVYGWPFSYREAMTDWDSQLQLVIPGQTMLFSSGALAADIAIVSLVVVLVAWILWRWGPQRFRPRFSMHGLLLFVVLAALVCAWLTHHHAVYLNEQASVGRLKAEKIACATMCFAPVWLQKVWPTKLPPYFDRVVAVAWGELSSKDSDPKASGTLLQSEILQFGQLRALMVDSAILPHLSDGNAFSTVERVQVRIHGDSRSIDFLTKLPHLREVRCPSLDGPDANQLVALANCASLEVLKTWDFRKYKPGVAEQFAHMKRLKVLEIMNAGEMDDDVPFASLPALEKLSIEDAQQMSDKALRSVLQISTLNDFSVFLWHCSPETSRLFEERFGKKMP